MSARAQSATPNFAVQHQPPQHVIDQIQKGVGQVRMLPEVAIKALQKTRDPNVNFKQFGGIVEKDVALTTRVLAMANSSLFAAGGSTASVAQGVSRLGFRQCKNIIISTCLASTMKSIVAQEQVLRETLWNHSLTTASTAKHLADKLDLDFGGEEFTAGMIHDFGRLLLATAFPKSEGYRDRISFAELPNQRELEIETIGCCHCAAGAWFGMDQGLPQELLAVIKYHHTPEDSVYCPDLVAVVALADELADLIQAEKTETFRRDKSVGIKALEKCGVNQVGERLESSFQWLLDSVEVSVQEMLDH